MKFIELFDLLFEGAREDFVIKQLGNQLVSAFQQKEKKPTTPEEIVNTLSKADPTPNKQFLQWISRSYIRGEFRAEDVGQIKLDLDLFSKIKNKLEIKDINQYKKLSDLRRAIIPFENQDVRSGKQMKKEEAAGFFERGEAEWFYRGSSLKILIPKTEAASCYFGKGTKWCTAATQSENMFDDYSSEAPLYIIITNSSERYQFWMADDEHQLMNVMDEEVDIVKFVERYPEVINAFRGKIPETDVLFVVFEDDPQKILKAVKQFGNALEFVPKQHKTFELCLEAVKENGKALNFVPEEHKTFELCLEAVKQFGWAIEFVPEEHRTFELYLEAVKQDGSALEYVPEEHRTFELCLEAVKQFGRAIEFVPEQHKEKIKQELGIK